MIKKTTHWKLPLRVLMLESEFGGHSRWGLVHFLAYLMRILFLIIWDHFGIYLDEYGTLLSLVLCRWIEQGREFIKFIHYQLGKGPFEAISGISWTYEHLLSRFFLHGDDI